MGEVVGKCPLLHRELRVCISTERSKEVSSIIAFKYKRSLCNLHLSQVEATMNGYTIRGCLIDRDAEVNVIANWFIKEVALEPTRLLSLYLKVIDQRYIKSLELVTNLSMTMNNILVKMSFYVFEITNLSRCYSIILGCF